MSTQQDGEPAASETSGHRHKTLSAYYPRLYTLHNYLLSAPTSSSSRVLLESDSEEYRQLVQGTLCAPTGDTPLSGWNGEVYGTQQEVVDRVVGEIAKRSARLDIKDVLVTSDKVRPLSHSFESTGSLM